MKKRLCLLIGLVLIVVLCFVPKEVILKNIKSGGDAALPVQQAGNGQIVIYTSEFDGGYSKISSLIVKSKEGNYITLNIEDNYQDIELDAGENSYTCKVSSSVNKNDFVDEMNQAVKDNKMSADEYLENMMKDGKVVFYMTGKVKEGIKDGQIYQNGSSTTYEIK
ncbi:MAG: hypothetical protein Q4F11_10245 [Eubacteriales bacterium]|nr:hypothetical protein [Eubacteriales bacterium]